MRVNVNCRYCTSFYLCDRQERKILGIIRRECVLLYDRNAQCLYQKKYPSPLPRPKNVPKAPKMKPPKKDWVKKFKGILKNFGDFEGGIYFNNENNVSFEDLLAMYLGVKDKSYPIDKDYKSPKVEIKCKNGCIQIERIK